MPLHRTGTREFGDNDRAGFSGRTSNEDLRFDMSNRRDGPSALGWVPAFPHCGFTLMLQKNPENESVRDQQ